MEKLIIKKVGQFYSSVESSTDAIGYLGGFLCYDVGSDIKSWKEWINDPENHSVSSNYSGLEKNGNSVTIAFEHDWFYETPGAPVFELTIAQMNYILDSWKEALEKKPNKIIIIKDDKGGIKVEFED
jgi:hypothetical protein